MSASFNRFGGRRLMKSQALQQRRRKHFNTRKHCNRQRIFKRSNPRHQSPHTTSVTLREHLLFWEAWTWVWRTTRTWRGWRRSWRGRERGWRGWRRRWRRGWGGRLRKKTPGQQGKVGDLDFSPLWVALLTFLHCVLWTGDGGEGEAEGGSLADAKVGDLDFDLSSKDENLLQYKSYK